MTPGWPRRPSPWTSRFRAFDAALDRHHPAGTAHWHLAILAVRPDRQGRGTGTALLRAGHAVLDQVPGTPAYLEASSARARDLYLAHGYALLPGAPFHLPGDGPPLWPMWRPPRARAEAAAGPAPGTAPGRACGRGADVTATAPADPARRRPARPERARPRGSNGRRARAGTGHQGAQMQDPDVTRMPGLPDGRTRRRP